MGAEADDDLPLPRDGVFARLRPTPRPASGIAGARRARAARSRAAQPAFRRLDAFARIPALRGRRGACRPLRPISSRRPSPSKSSDASRTSTPSSIRSCASRPARLRRSLERYYLLSGDSRFDSHRASQGKLCAGCSWRPPRRQHRAAPRRNTRMSGRRSWCTHSCPDAARDESPCAATARGTDRRVVPLRHRACHAARRCELLRSAARDDGAFRTARCGARRGAANRMFAARLVDRLNGQQIWADEFHASRQTLVGNPTSAGSSPHASAPNTVSSPACSRANSRRVDSSGDSFASIARCQHFMFSRQIGALLPAVEALQAADAAARRKSSWPGPRWRGCTS